jgi:hypothetical protein
MEVCLASNKFAATQIAESKNANKKSNSTTASFIASYKVGLRLQSMLFTQRPVVNLIEKTTIIG